MNKDTGLLVDFEWNPRFLNGFSDDRKVDAVVLTQLVGHDPVPLLLVKYSIEEAPLESFNKDQGKCYVFCL